MDNDTSEAVKWFVKKFLEDKPLQILDVGSYNVNGCNRTFIENPKWKYLGLDIFPGPNVDIVVNDPYHYPFESNKFDVVISTNAVEHVEDIYAWADEITRVLKPGGWMCVTAPCMLDEHKYPYDCWRFYPDGFRWLFVKRTNIMKERNIQLIGTQCTAVLQKGSTNE